MKSLDVFTFCLVLALIGVNDRLYCQSQTSAENTIKYELVRSTSSLFFASNYDTLHFEPIKKVKKYDQSTPILKITDSHTHSYSVSSFFSSSVYSVSDHIANDSVIITYGDMPYGELILDGLPRIDQVSYNLKVNRLDCIVSINGVKGEPTIDLDYKDFNKQKSKRQPISELLIANSFGEEIFCISKRETTHTAFYTLQFNKMNSQKLNERLKLSALFIFWLYERQ
jgi:hypothetical protein